MVKLIISSFKLNRLLMQLPVGASRLKIVGQGFNRVTTRTECLSAATLAARELLRRLGRQLFRRAFERNRACFFFGYFLLATQKKVTHRQVKSLLGGLAAKAKIHLCKRSSLLREKTPQNHPAVKKRADLQSTNRSQPRFNAAAVRARRAWQSSAEQYHHHSD